jgi:hypothetical protein
MNRTDYVRSFEKRTSYGDVASFYMNHPGRVLQILWRCLTDEAKQMRAVNLSNYQKRDGHPAGARAEHFDTWSSLRTWLFEHAPWHILIWYALVFAGCVAVFLRQSSPVPKRLAAICAALATVAVFEFGAASLADACETYRHLFLFHAVTDITVCFAIAAPKKVWG